MTQRLTAAALLACTLFFTACGALFDPGPPPARLQLNPAMPAKTAAAPVNKQLTVATPLAGRDIDSDRIALVFHGREVRALADANWTAPVPYMLQRDLIAAFEASGVLLGVGDESAGIASDARLLSDIRQFSLLYAEEGGVPAAVFEATFRLMSLSTGRIMGVHEVNVRVPAGGKDNAALVNAMESALGKGLRDVVAWAEGTMRRMP